MAKKRKPVQTNVVKKNAWSVVSIWWGILVFGLLIPALFIVACLDINSYKKAVWNHVEKEKDTAITRLNDQLDDDIKAVENEIAALEKENVSLQAQIDASNAKIAQYNADLEKLSNQSFLAPLRETLRNYETWMAIGLPEAQTSNLFGSFGTPQTDYVYAAPQFEHKYTEILFNEEVFVVEQVRPSFVTTDVCPETFDANIWLKDFKATYNLYLTNNVIQQPFMSFFPEEIAEYKDAHTDALSSLMWTDTDYVNDPTYKNLSKMIDSLDGVIDAIEELINNYNGVSTGVEEGITSVNTTMSVVKNTIDSNSYASNDVKQQISDLTAAQGGIFNDVDSTFNSDKVEELKALRANLFNIFKKYTERLLIEREREFFYGLYTDAINGNILSDRRNPDSVVQKYINTYKDSDNVILKTLAEKIEAQLPEYAEAYYDYKVNSETNPSVTAVDFKRSEKIEPDVQTHLTAYVNDNTISRYCGIIEGVKNSLADVVDQDVLVKVHHGIGVSATMDAILADAASNLFLDDLQAWFDNIREDIEYANSQLKTGYWGVAVYSVSQFDADKKAFSDAVTADIRAAIEYEEDLIAKNSLKIETNKVTINQLKNKITNWENSYRKTIQEIEALLKELCETKNARKYDSVKNRVYNVGEGRTYTLGYQGTDSLLGLTCGLIKNLLNPTGSLSRYQLIAIVCLVIAVGILLLTYIIQIIRIIIAKKTAWIFHDGAVIYRKGRIFYTEEFTRDMEFFPGMSVSVRHSIKGKIFKYGDVIVSNGAGEAGEIVMRGVRNPKKVHEMISQMLVMCCTRTANMMSPYKMYPQMYRHVLGGYPAYYYGTMQMNNMNNPNNGGK